MKRSFDRVVEDALLVLYHRNMRYHRGKWDFQSAFKLLPYEVAAAQRETVIAEFIKRGWGEFTPVGSGESKKLGFALSPRGESAAIETLELRSSKGLVARLHRINWSTWGGIAAIVSAIAAVIAAAPVVQKWLE